MLGFSFARCVVEDGKCRLKGKETCSNEIYQEQHAPLLQIDNESMFSLKRR